MSQSSFSSKKTPNNSNHSEKSLLGRIAASGWLGPTTLKD